MKKRIRITLTSAAIVLQLMIVGVAAKEIDNFDYPCYPDKANYYLFVMGHCYPEKACCKNNLECASGCCDPYTNMCNLHSKSHHFLENFPYSTACMSVPTTFVAL